MRRKFLNEESVMSAIIIQYVELSTISMDIFRKNSRTNVEISGKKKRKIMKQIKRLQKNKLKDGKLMIYNIIFFI